jgi:putative two-component system response regulator
MHELPLYVADSFPGHSDQEAQVATLRSMFGTPRPSLEPILHGTHPSEVLTNPKIAIVDDQPINVAVVQKHLKMAGYAQFVTTTDAREAMDLIVREWPDVVLLDIMMPYRSGLDILADLRRDDRFSDLPVIILTAASERQTKLDALKLGATEFLHKPFDAVELETRLRNVLVLKAHQDRLKNYAWELEIEVAARSTELAEMHREVVRCLARVGEFRDNDTGKHVVRVGKYAAIVARCLGLNPEFVERIGEAAALHDIGKVAIPDAILLKPGKLGEAEFATMKGHCEYGRRVCSQETAGDDQGFVSHATTGHSICNMSRAPVLQMAAVIAHTHHERWDGTGYPQGLSGEQIPLEGRITAVADVFDALTNARPYKPPFPLEASLEIIRAQRGTQFDPKVVDAFFAGLDQIISVYYEHHEDGRQSGQGPSVSAAATTAEAGPPTTTAEEPPK